MRRLCIVILSLAFIVSFIPCGFTDEAAGTGANEEIQTLKVQVQELMKRIEELEKQQVKQKEDFTKQKDELSKAAASRVDLANTLSKLKLKGRWAAGYLQSGQSGSFGKGSFEIPEGKIQFSFQPDDINTIVMRFNVNNATSQTPLMDYFYLQSKDFLPFLKSTPCSLSSRLGRFKLGFGEETWTNNPVEGILPSNSAGNAGLNDEGLELAGKVKLDKIGLEPLGWVASVSNGIKGVNADTTSSKAFMGKLYHNPIGPLYVSVSYYDSGNLGAADSEMSIAGLVNRPTGANNWERKFWEADARYDFCKGKKLLEPIAFSDSKAILRLSYGAFHDNSSTAASTPFEREGNFGFTDGIYNLTKKIYTAGRVSFVDLNGDTVAVLNNVNANKYLRYSLGIGYRWSENTLLKLSYDWNKNSGPGVDDADDNLLSAVVASQF